MYRSVNKRSPLPPSGKGLERAREVIADGSAEAVLEDLRAF
ncbi:hypothetical protein [Halomontanus rarus]|nr:hypothetical protein [Halovivax sp. TS33]